MEPIVEHIKNLHHEKTIIRLNAIDALKKVGGKEVVPHLIEALNDHQQVIVRNAIEALGLKGDHRALKPILDTMDKYYPLPNADFAHQFHIQTIVDSAYDLATPKDLPFLIKEHSKAGTEEKRQVLEQLIEKIEKTEIVE